MIDFAKTQENLLARLNSLDQMDREFALANVMESVAREGRDGRLRFSEHDTDAFSRSFICYARRHGALVLA